MINRRLGEVAGLAPAGFAMPADEGTRVTEYNAIGKERTRENRSTTAVQENRVRNGSSCRDHDAKLVDDGYLDLMIDDGTGLRWIEDCLPPGLGSRAIRVRHQYKSLNNCWQAS